jgi:D-alanyl-D-alanine carboxypeptidase
MAVARRHHATRRRSLLLCAVVLAWLVTLVPAGQGAFAQSGIDDPLRARLQDVLDQARPAEPVPGISAAIETPESLWTGVTGKSSLDPRRPVAADTPFSIGSVTKTFVAAVVLQLREEGKLSLSDHLSRWETKVPNASRITVRQLLSHTSGVRDMWWDPRYTRRVEGRPTHVWTYAEVRAMIGPPRFAPGTRFEYSNSNYVLLGRIITLVTGRTVAQEIRTRFLDPLGLDDTWYQGAEHGPRRVAMGYLRRGGTWVPQGNGTGLRPTTSIATFFGASGAMVSTPTDLARWARALYGGHVLDPGSLQLMTAFNSHGYGLGTRRVDMGGRPAWGHGGSLDGFETSMWYLPSIDSSVVVIWNRRGDDTDPTARKLARRLADALDPDVTPPTIGVPRVSIRAAADVPPGRAPILVTWPAAQDSQGSIARYELRRRTAGGPWQTVRLASSLSRSATLTVATGSTLDLQVRAWDARQNASSWVAAAPVVARFIDDDASSVQADAGWRRRSVADALGGGWLESVTPASRLTFTGAALSMAVVGPRSRSLTSASVRLDALPGVVVRLAAPQRQPHRSLLAHRWSGPVASHTMRINVRPAGHPRVDIDGFLVLELVPPSP